MSEESNVGSQSGTFYDFEPGVERIDVSSLLPVMCYRFKNGKWRFRSIPAECWNIEVGNNPELTDVSINEPYADDVHVVLQLAGNQWYIVESGRNSIMKVNGFEKRQGTISPHSSVFLRVGMTPMVFTVGAGAVDAEDAGDDGFGTHVMAPTPKLKVDAIDFSPPKKHFGLITEKGEKAFPVGRNVLLGANPLCDVRLPGDEFAAVISCCRNQFFIHNTSQTDIFVNSNKIGEEPVPMSDGVEVVVSHRKMIFRLPEDQRDKPFLNRVPDFSGVNLALLEVFKDGSSGKSYILPATGRSISAGRDKSNYVVIDSPKVSRTHAQIVIQEHAVMLVDSGTSNGTYVDGARVMRTVVRPGHIIRFADQRYLLCYSE